MTEVKEVMKVLEKNVPTAIAKIIIGYLPPQFEVNKVYVSNYFYFKVVKRTKHFLTIKFLNRRNEPQMRTKLRFNAKYGGEYINLRYFILSNNFKIMAFNIVD